MIEFAVGDCEKLTVPLTVTLPANVRLFLSVPAPLQVPPVIVIAVVPAPFAAVIVRPPHDNVLEFTVAAFIVSVPLTTHAPDRVIVRATPAPNCNPPVNVLPPLVSVAVAVIFKSDVPAIVIPEANVTLPATVRAALNVSVFV